MVCSGCHQPSQMPDRSISHRQQLIGHSKPVLGALQHLQCRLSICVCLCVFIHVCLSVFLSKFISVAMRKKTKETDKKRKTRLCLCAQLSHLSTPELLVIPSRVFHPPEDAQINIYSGAGAYRVRVSASPCCTFVIMKFQKQTPILIKSRFKPAFGVHGLQSYLPSRKL